jgi:hypothetical protein
LRKVVGVVVACALLAAGCGGVAELDSGDTQTVSLARQAVDEAVAKGSLSPAGEKQLTDLIALCREKPLSESDGKSMREILTSLAPQLKQADAAFSKKLERIARNGCD